jgi:UDP-glucose 4-epimerase
VNSRAHFYQCDIRDQAAIEGIFQTEKPAVVNHHAAQMDVRRGVREPLFDADVNILGSINLLGASITHEVKRFIYIASAGAGYGEPQVSLVGEDHPINPITPYGISKHTVEHYLFTFRFLYGLEYAVLRYGNVYGPRQNSQGEAGVFAIFSEQMLAGVQPVIYGDGHKVRDYVYISDVVAANVAALEGGTNEIFNIGTGVETKDLEVFETVRSLLGKEVEPKYAPRRPGEIDRICLDIAKANSLLNWRPVVGLSEGARLTVAYFQKEAVSKAASATS